MGDGYQFQNPAFNAAMAQLILAEINSATPIFVCYYQGTDQGSDPASTPTQYYVYYARVNDIMIPIGSHVVPRDSGWAGIRTGLIFVGSVVLSAVGAPVISAEMSALASGADVAAAGAAAGATNSTIVTTLASTASTVTGNQDIGLAGKIINLATGNAPGAASTGVSTVDDDYLDLSDLASTDSPFDSFNFSSGEALAQWSDAQSTDFGLGTLGFDGVNPYDPNTVTGFGTDPTTGNVMSVGDVNTQAWNTTPEVLTNDFGTTFDGPIDVAGASGGSGWTSPVDPNTAIGAAKIAASASGSAANPNAAASVASAGGAGQKAVAVAAGSNDVLSTVGKVLSGGVAAVGGVASQITSAQPKTYTGQLGAAGGSTVGLPANMNTIALIGAALVGVAIFMHLKG